MIETLQVLTGAVTLIVLLAIYAVPPLIVLGRLGANTLFVGVITALASVALASLAAPFMGLHWNVLLPLGVSLIVALALLVAKRFFPNQFKPAKPKKWLKPYAISILIAGSALTAVFLANLPRADAVSQTFDAIFHLNATRLILDSGSASPLDMDLSAPGQNVFYPTLWHALVSLVVSISGLSIPAATNGAIIATMFIVWPVGVIALGRAVAGPSTKTVYVSGLAAAAFPTLPLTLASFGVLYPNMLAMVLTPYIFVLLATVFRVGWAKTAIRFSPLLTTVLILATLGTAALAHPNALHATALIALPLAFFALIRRKTVTATLVFAATVLATGALWFIGKTSDNPWGGKHGPRGALFDALGTTPRIEGDNWMVSAVIAVGVLIALRYAKWRPLIGSAAAIGTFYIVADGFPPSDMRTLIIGPWYSDPWRLAALTPIAFIPLFILGGTFLIKQVYPGALKLFKTLIPKNSAAPLFKAFGIVAVALIATSLLQPASTVIEPRYSATADMAPLLSDNERELLEELPNYVQEDGMVVANPWNGGSLAYAISDRKVLMPHARGAYPPELLTLADGISSGEQEACELAEKYGATHVLDFGSKHIFNDDELIPQELQNLNEINDPAALTLVKSVGETKLYEITGC